MDLADDNQLREVFAQIEAIATAKLAGEANSSLSTGDLVNEAVMRLSKIDRMTFAGRTHMLALASRMMRQILIDQARRRNAQKRYHSRVTLVTNLPGEPVSLDALDFGYALEDLRAIDEQRADIVEMRYFGGMTIEEIADHLDLSASTVKRRWIAARTWMQERMS